MIAIEGAYVATVDAAGTEHPDGHVVIDGGLIIAVGPGPAPPGATKVDGRGLLVTPGLVNSHHHLYQWITRGYATDNTLFEWLTALYPVWARLTPELVHDAAAANLGWLALTGCTMSTDHHYVHPTAGQLEATIEAAGEIGLRFHPTRGSMNLGRSAGGLPPDEVVEEHDAILAATADAIDRWHDPSPSSMLRIAVAPCSPFSVTADLMRDSAALAREKGVRLHTHLAETLDEEEYCRATFGSTPAELAEDLGWLGPDVWFAHCVHLSDVAVQQFAATQTSVAHCPTSNGRLGAGIAPVRALRTAGAGVGLGVDGAASNESGRMVDELHQSVLAARYAGGPLALASRAALEMGTMGGARCLGRAGELGSLEVGKLADLALWRVDGLAGAGIDDPVCTLVLGAAQLDRLYVGGREVVTDGQLQTADAPKLAARAAAASREIAWMDFLSASTWADALTVKSSHPDAVPIAGGTDLMVELNFDRRRPEALLDLTGVPELTQWSRDNGSVRIGAGVPYTRLINELADVLPGLAIASRSVGSPQIRNRGTLAGNLATSSPAGDALPPLWVADAVIEVESARGARSVPVAEFFLGPKRNVMEPDELIRAVVVPVAAGPQQFAKVGTRNAMVISVCSFALALKDGSVAGCIGSAGPTVLPTAEADAFAAAELDWEGRGELDDRVATRFGDLVADAARPIDDVRGSAAYRRHAVGVLARRTLQWCWEEYR